VPTFDRRLGRPVSRTPARPIKPAAVPPGRLVPIHVQRLGRPLAAEVWMLPDTPEGRLAARVRQYRVERGWSQAELASRMSDLDHGWHQTTVAKTERAERDPRYPELLALAEALAVPLDALLGLAFEPEAEDMSEARFKVHRLEQEEQFSFDGLAVWSVVLAHPAPRSARCSLTSCRTSPGGGSRRLCLRAWSRDGWTYAKTRPAGGIATTLAERS